MGLVVLEVGLYSHHEASIQRVVAHFERDDEAVGLLLGGSLAHGYATPASDVDVMIVVPDEVYERRQAEGRIHFWNQALTTYEGGYVDGKYTSAAYIRQVAERGSEPARYAFQDARVLLDRQGGLTDWVVQASGYPEAGVEDRIASFTAQVEGWRWYAGEAFRHENPHLIGWSVHRLVLFGGRLILAHNRLLFPFHKWFLRVLAAAPDRPEDLMERIDALHREPCAQTVEAFYETVVGFREWAVFEHGWGPRFMADSELNWQHGPVAMDDW